MFCFDGHATVLNDSAESPAHTLSIPGKRLQLQQLNSFIICFLVELLKVYRANFLFHAHQMYQVPFVDERLSLRFAGQMVCT